MVSSLGDLTNSSQQAHGVSCKLKVGSQQAHNVSSSCVFAVREMSSFKMSLPWVFMWAHSVLAACELKFFTGSVLHMLPNNWLPCVSPRGPYVSERQVCWSAGQRQGERPTNQSEGTCFLAHELNSWLLVDKCLRERFKWPVVAKEERDTGRPNN